MYRYKHLTIIALIGLRSLQALMMAQFCCGICRRTSPLQLRQSLHPTLMVMGLLVFLTFCSLSISLGSVKGMWGMTRGMI